MIVISKNNFIIWQYKTPKSSSVAGLFFLQKNILFSYSVIGTRTKCKMFHIDDNPTGAVEVIQELDNMDKITVSTETSKDPACCISCTDKCLIIGRESGLLQYYALPHVVLINKYQISLRPHKISINCNSTLVVYLKKIRAFLPEECFRRLSVIDVAGTLTVLDASDAIGRFSNSTSDNNNRLERKDVWAMCWASDNPQLLAIMEKTRMYIFKGIYPEEPVSCSGYICSFNVKEILLFFTTKKVYF